MVVYNSNSVGLVLNFLAFFFKLVCCGHVAVRPFFFSPLYLWTTGLFRHFFLYVVFEESLCRIFDAALLFGHFVVVVCFLVTGEAT